jgi:PAS domain S-box-containing protein
MAFGYTFEEFLGLNTAKLDADPETGKKVIQDLATKGKWSGEVINIRKNKEKFPSILSAFVIKDEKGNPKGMMGIIKDITEQKKAEKELKESEEKYRNVVERANDGIVIIQDMIIKYVNPRSFDILGYDPMEMIGALMTNYIHPSELPKVVEYYKRRIAGEDAPRAYESAFVHKDGRRIDVELSGGVITYQGKTADMIMIHDVTERKKAEKELKEKIEELERYKKITVDREMKMIELKTEINKLHEKLGEKSRYNVTEESKK